MTRRYPTNLVLIGMPGSGKSTVGRHLSRLTKKKWRDTDHALSERLGQPIASFFATHGEAAFRDAEHALLTEWLSVTNMVLSTGGGIVCHALNRPLLRAIGYVVFIDVPLAALWERLKEDRKRPLLQTDRPYDALASLYHTRHALYERCAHLTIPVTQWSSQHVAKGILTALSA
ncbi:shikimate kinase [bacterium]|nr:shikimate kinase [bacterium]